MRFAVGAATLALALCGCDAGSHRGPGVDAGAGQPGRKMINDWFRDGRYSWAELRHAVAQLPADGPWTERRSGTPHDNARERDASNASPRSGGTRAGQRTSGGSVAGLPLVAPGQLQGRFRYLSNKECELRQYDLTTGTDTAVASSQLCRVGWPVFAGSGAGTQGRGR